MVTFKFYTTDHLGSVRGIWDGEWSSSVNNLATYDYTPYGDILQQSGLPLDVGFTGHHWDNHIQQYFAPFRFYSPTTLRWNMRDPLGFIDGPNVYAYVGGNPVMQVDLNGGSAKEWCIKQWNSIYNWVTGKSPEDEDIVRDGGGIIVGSGVSVAEESVSHVVGRSLYPRAMDSAIGAVIVAPDIVGAAMNQRDKNRFINESYDFNCDIPTRAGGDRPWSKSKK